MKAWHPGSWQSAGALASPLAGNPRTTLVGNPPPAVAAELRRPCEWRQGR